MTHVLYGWTQLDVEPPKDRACDLLVVSDKESAGLLLLDWLVVSMGKCMMEINHHLYESQVNQDKKSFKITLKRLPHVNKMIMITM